ncbi:MAG: hypothetical protein ACJAUE_000184 [Alcanivorax sp.]|jgi:hypothetical protein
MAKGESSNTDREKNDDRITLLKIMLTTVHKRAKNIMNQ